MRRLPPQTTHTLCIIGIEPRVYGNGVYAGLRSSGNWRDHVEMEKHLHGSCGEEDRPLNELLILQLGSEHPNGRNNISLCKIFGSHWNHEKRRFPQGAETELVYVNKGEQHKRASETEPKQAVLRNSDDVHAKKRKTSDSKPCEVESEQEEHSLSLSQHSSPSQSDQEQTPIRAKPRPLCYLKQRFQNPNVNNVVEIQPDQISRPEGQFSMDRKPIEAMPVHSLIGADVRGKVVYLSVTRRSARSRSKLTVLIEEENERVLNLLIDYSYTWFKSVN
ncbi:hypothetical protein MKW98_014969 [Papaver atlanticum]|uniref:Uncharacterized protein n=1 Tax=Papaver atlanticum TaxID=357466 RepID=A0AAD4SNG6_9MAGN|nr:hypothetical protein MKW98_014969 [Papaver atlanticum]